MQRCHWQTCSRTVDIIGDSRHMLLIMSIIHCSLLRMKFRSTLELVCSWYGWMDNCLKLWCDLCWKILFWSFPSWATSAFISCCVIFDLLARLRGKFRTQTLTLSLNYSGTSHAPTTRTSSTLGLVLLWWPSAYRVSELWRERLYDKGEIDLSLTVRNNILFAAGLFTLAGLYQMTVWALGKHRNYKKEFKNYPRGRKSIIPFLI